MNQLTPITPTRPAAPYIGGKRLLAAKIIKRIDAVSHVTYAVPFVGMGGVFLRRDKAPRAEVINDYSGDVATFFRILQRHYPHFMEMLKFQLTSRKEFERLRKANPDTLTDLERAARFLYLQKMAFGGLRTGQAFGAHVTGPVRFNILKLGPLLEDIHERLAGVAIECLHYEQFIKRYDRTTTLFYLDPPYYGIEDYYGRNLFHRDDFQKLAGQLAKIKGSFIMSINDTPEVRHIFRAFTIEEASVVYTAAAGANKRTHELLISNCRTDNCPASDTEKDNG
ncbi:DNA adenine methylase [Kordiimonas pumila]|uniref:site-specific DNA-methyltransferase (adenine-specific) n=1 Tax=Kordiimonas pumila TaxID=2161677 RepID=A0ABV7D8G7_9PROT|nr:DNA adenine methylase [Kordiimonas pumila]